MNYFDLSYEETCVCPQFPFKTKYEKYPDGVALDVRALVELALRRAAALGGDEDAFERPGHFSQRAMLQRGEEHLPDA